MGEVIRLAERRQARRERPQQRSASLRAEFLFDLACPFTYLAAERVERAFDDVTWTPASTTALRRGSLADDEVALAAVRAAAEERAAAVRLPLVWPENWPAEVPAAMRVAAHAADAGRGAAFVLAAGRLAFCGGFDLDDPEILAEAAAAAGLGSTPACTPRATAAATARSRRPGAACSRSAPTGCRRCGSGAPCTGARHRWPTRPPPRGFRPPPPASS